MPAIALNVAANTNDPGFRGPVFSDGRFEYIPISESEPTSESVPTYGDLAPHLETPIPEDIRSVPVHLDPEFESYPFCDRYTYGDEHGVKAGPLANLSAGDYVFFYATLSVTEGTDWQPPEWGAFIIGQFRLARDPFVPGDGELPKEIHRQFRTNAHVRRDQFDARVLLAGDPEESRLYDHVTPLSAPAGGTTPNWLVTDCSGDSGRGPWWRRPLRFDASATEQLLDVTQWDPSRVVTYQ